jgi:DNA adenine methylase
VLQTNLFGDPASDAPRIHRVPFDAPAAADVADAAPCWKWVGGKGESWREIGPLLPERIRGAYFEPFFGGGATFWSLVREGRLAGPVVLNDKNPVVARALIGIRDAPGAVLSLLRGYEQSYRRAPKETYLEVRETVPTWGDKSPEAVASGLMFLSRAGFNGLWRVNSKGHQNVGWCKDGEVRIVFEERLLACARALRGVQILHTDFARLLGQAERGDVVFVDPPYVPASATANFTSYTQDGFSGEDQIRVRDEVDACALRGVHVLACNADLPAVRALYNRPSLEVLSIRVRSAVNSDPNKRGHVGEVIVKPRRAA